VKRVKVVLIHKAEVESVRPVLRTKIGWTSTVVNVAGDTSSPVKLDPIGEDVFGFNSIVGEFFNVGTFDTPYVNDTVRLSRTSGPVSEQLRVFVRRGASPPPPSLLTPNDDNDEAVAMVMEPDADRIVEDGVKSMLTSVKDYDGEDFEDPFGLALLETNNDNEEG